MLVGPVAADAQRRLDNIRAHARRLVGLIDACFAEDRLGEKGVVLRVRPFDPMAMIEDVAQHHRLLHARTIRMRAEALPAICTCAKEKSPTRKKANGNGM